MLTRKTRYALRALVVLAERGDRSPRLISELAARESMPHKFLETILRELAQQGLLRAQRGRGGGVSLRIDPSQISLAHVLRVLDGTLVPLPCVTGDGNHRRCEECRRVQVCGVRVVMQEFYESSVRFLEGKTLADLLPRSADAEGGGASSYAI